MSGDKILKFLNPYIFLTCRVREQDSLSYCITKPNQKCSIISGSDKYMKPITSNGLQLSPTGLTPTPGEVPVRRMVAMYDYDPQELSPNVDAEVLLQAW